MPPPSVHETYLPLPIDPNARVAVPFGAVPEGQEVPEDAPAMLCRYPSKLEAMRVRQLIADFNAAKTQAEQDGLAMAALDIYVRGWKNMPEGVPPFDPAKPGASVAAVVAEEDFDDLALSVIPMAVKLGRDQLKKSVSPSGSLPESTGTANTATASAAGN